MEPSNLLPVFLHSGEPTWAIGARILFELFVLFAAISSIVMLVRLELSTAARAVLASFVVLLAAFEMWALVAFDLPGIAKLTLVQILFVYCICGILIYAYRDDIHSVLVTVEEDANDLRDVTMFQGTMARAKLAELSEKLKRGQQPEERAMAKTAFAALSPLAMLWFKKETSFIKWGMAAFGAGKAIMKHFQANT